MKQFRGVEMAIESLNKPSKVMQRQALEAWREAEKWGKLFCPFCLDESPYTILELGNHVRSGDCSELDPQVMPEIDPLFSPTDRETEYDYQREKMWKEVL